MQCRCFRLMKQADDEMRHPLAFYWKKGYTVTIMQMMYNDNEERFGNRYEDKGAS